MHALIVVLFALPDPTEQLVVRGVTSLSVGQALPLRAEVIARNARGNDQPPVPARSCRWKSSEPNIVTVDKTGLITGVRSGTASIRASCGGHEAQVSVEVWDSSVVGSFTGHAWVALSNVQREELCELNLALSTSGARLTQTTRTWSVMSSLVLALDGGAAAKPRPTPSTADAVTTLLDRRWPTPSVTTWSGPSIDRMTSSTGAATSFRCRRVKWVVFKRPARWDRERTRTMDCAPSTLGPVGPSQLVDLLECRWETPVDLGCAGPWLLSPDGSNPVLRVQELSDCQSRSGLWELTDKDVELLAEEPRIH